MRAAVLDENIITNIVMVSSVSDSADIKWLSDLSPLRIGDEYSQELAEMGQTPPQQLVPIVIESVTGDLDGFDDGHNEYTCRQNEQLILVGPLAVPDQFFRIPLVRTDTGREVPVVAEVKSQVMTITAVFPTAGYWECNSELINRAFEHPLFSMDTLKFTVI
jgi:hypothetical protein